MPPQVCPAIRIPSSHHPFTGAGMHKSSRLLTASRRHAVAEHDNWVHELNLDPRFRVSAGFGTRVVQTNKKI